MAISTADDNPLASSRTLLHSIEVRKDFLVLLRKFPPRSVEIRYNEIASVEHKRLADYSYLVWVAAALILAYIFSAVDATKKIMEALLAEIKDATGSTIATADAAVLFITAVFIIIAAFYMIRFALSLSQRLVIYRSGKSPIAVPMVLTGDSMKVLSELNRKVKEASGMSKEEVEKFIGEQIRSLLDQRVQMQEDILAVARKELKAAKSEEDKKRVKQILQDGMDKLKAQDEAIDRELKKTGLKKEELFEKYRIKPPENEFIDSILKSEGITLKQPRKKRG